MSVETGRKDLVEELTIGGTTAIQRRIKFDWKREAEMIHLAQ